jgi:hypothetical protein
VRAVIGIAAVLVLVAGQAIAEPVRFDAELAALLQPLRARALAPKELPPPLRPIAVAHGKQQWSVACQAADKLRRDRMIEAAVLFYGIDRNRPDLHGIATFLDANVRGAQPLFEIRQEGFVPSALWRGLGVDACVRAGVPDRALPFVAYLGADDVPGRVARAVLLAQSARSWQGAAVGLESERASVRVLALRALAAGPRTGSALAAEADRAAVLPDERALVDALRKAMAP